MTSLNFGDFLLFFIGGWALIFVGVFSASESIMMMGGMLTVISYVIIIYIVIKAIFVTTVHRIKVKLEENSDE